VKCWLIVPAAGVGRRVGGDLPKQYQTVAGRPLLSWTLAALAPLAAAATVLVVSPDDPHIDDLAEEFHEALPGLTILREGGASRAESVQAGLRWLGERAAPEDGVLVHDAARPCVTPAALSAVRAALATQKEGVLLAQPLDETVKWGAEGRVVRTLDRRNLWRAQTPQGASLAVLSEALALALAEAPETVTDEASALEALGLSPALVPGEVSNLKVTHPQDLALAEFWLQQQGRYAPCA
jgi:2-C-methyl-D-erythritol 4-phosphate cytidylyltransferase